MLIINYNLFVTKDYTNIHVHIMILFEKIVFKLLDFTNDKQILESRKVKIKWDFFIYYLIYESFERDKCFAQTFETSSLDSGHLLL